MAKKHAHARASARRHALSSAVPHVCSVCGFEPHVTVAHIRAVSEFAIGTPTAIINNDENLSLLCPNCHWLWDNHKMRKRPPSIADLCKRMHKPVIVKPTKAKHKRRYSTGRKAAPKKGA